MKRNLIAMLSLVVVSLIFNATSVYAQSFAKAHVPFAFNVGQKRLPAGTYELKIDGVASSNIMIRNIETKESTLSIAGYEPPRNTESKLVFNRVGNEYFLSQVWSGSGSPGMRIPTSKRERELRKELLLAKDAKGGHEEVMVALK
jgi:hypothetical protein